MKSIIKTASLYLILIVLSLISFGSIPKQSADEIIKNGNIFYLSHTVVFQIKTPTEKPSLNKINSVLDSFNSLSTKKIFSQIKEDKTNKLSRIYISKYTKDNDPFIVAKKLMETGQVDWAEPKFVYRTAFVPNDPDYSTFQYSLPLIHAPEAWDISKGDTSIVIGIIDTGVDWDHPDLADNIKINYNEIPNNGIDDDNNGYIDDVRGWDFGGLIGNPDNNPMEDNPDHGTNVAGIASAVSDNNFGVASIGFKSKILPVKTSQDNRRDAFGNPFVVFGFEGIQYAAENGAKVINTSWGGGGFSILGQEIIDFAISKGALVVAAAGNDGSSETFYPASYKGVLSVAATDKFDSKASFSNYGENIDVSAPGEGIYSTWQNDTFATLSGTSMSSPLAAGLAALVMARFPSYTPLQIAEQIRVNSDDIDSLNAQFKNLIGKGRINAFKALNNINSVSVRADNFSFFDFAPGGNNNGLLEPGETVSLSINLTNYLNPTNNLSVTLQTESQFVVISSGNFNAGSIATLSAVNNSATPFTFNLDPNTPPNTKIKFKLVYSDGTYTDFQLFSVIANPTFFTQTGNDIAITITSKGNLGFNDFPNNLQGDGFVYKNASNLLFEGALLMGTSSTKIVDAARAISTQDKDFITELPFAISIPGTASDIQGLTIFNDNGANSNKIGLRIKQQSYTFVNEPFKNFIVFRYSITNTSAVIVNNLYAGLFFDWDLIDGSGDGDVAKYDSVGNFGYVYNTTTGPDTWVAVAYLASSGFGFWAIKNDGGDGGFSIFDRDGFSKTEKWQALSSGIGKAQAGPADISEVTSGGPFSIQPNETIDVGFAIAAGNNLDELRAAITNAKIKYNNILTDVKLENPSLPIDFSLSQNYPNPFNPSTNINFSIPKESFVNLKIFDVLGKEVAILVNERLNAGNYNYNFNANGLPSGIYFYRLTVGSFVSTKKMILLR